MCRDGHHFPTDGARHHTTTPALLFRTIFFFPSYFFGRSKMDTVEQTSISVIGRIFPIFSRPRRPGLVLTRENFYTPTRQYSGTCSTREKNKKSFTGRLSCTPITVAQVPSFSCTCIEKLVTKKMRVSTIRLTMIIQDPIVVGCDAMF